MRSPTLTALRVVKDHLVWAAQDFWRSVTALPQLFVSVRHHERAHARMRQVWADWAKERPPSDETIRAWNAAADRAVDAYIRGDEQ